MKNAQQDTSNRKKNSGKGQEQKNVLMGERSPMLYVYVVLSDVSSNERKGESQG